MLDLAILTAMFLLDFCSLGINTVIALLHPSSFKCKAQIKAPYCKRQDMEFGTKYKQIGFWAYYFSKKNYVNNGPNGQVSCVKWLG